MNEYMYGVGEGGGGCCFLWDCGFVALSSVRWCGMRKRKRKRGRGGGVGGGVFRLGGLG